MPMFPDPSLIGPDGQLEPSFVAAELDDPPPPSPVGYVLLFGAVAFVMVALGAAWPPSGRGW
jgi:hypothetical protein